MEVDFMRRKTSALQGELMLLEDMLKVPDKGIYRDVDVIHDEIGLIEDKITYLDYAIHQAEDKHRERFEEDSTFLRVVDNVSK